MKTQLHRGKIKIPSAPMKKKCMERMVKRNWVCLSRGCPDFLCIRGNEVIFVEAAEQLGQRQKIFMALLTKQGVPCFQWTQAQGLVEVLFDSKEAANLLQTYWAQECRQQQILLLGNPMNLANNPSQVERQVTAIWTHGKELTSHEKLLLQTVKVRLDQGNATQNQECMVEKLYERKVLKLSV